MVVYTMVKNVLMVLRGFRVVRVSRVLRVLWILRVLKVLRVLRVLGDLYGIPSNQGRSQRGAGGQCPHHESRLPPPHANFRNLAYLEEAIEKM